MTFMKDVVLYESKTTKVYINQCHNIGKKTRLYTVRRDDNSGMGWLLGRIQWHGAWRQYVFAPEKNTVWNHDCLEGIHQFLSEINMNHRAKHKHIREARL